MWPPTITPCECDQAGWCVRHRCFKPAAMHLLCRRSQRAFERWERGQGPCHPGVVPVDDESGDHTAPGPGIVRRAVNYTVAVARHVANGGTEVDDAVYEARLAVCRACPSCDTGPMVCREVSCGCFVEKKARWESERCPRREWPELEGNEV